MEADVALSTSIADILWKAGGDKGVLVLYDFIDFRLSRSCDDIFQSMSIQTFESKSKLEVEIRSHLYQVPLVPNVVSK